MTYPLKFRQHVLSVRAKENLTLEETSIRFQIGRASLTRWLRNITPRSYNRPMRKINLEALREDVLLHNDMFIRERAKRFSVSYEPMRRALKKLNISNKKNSSSPKDR